MEPTEPGSDPKLTSPLSFGLVIAESTSRVTEHFEALAEWMRANAELDLVSRGAPIYQEVATQIRKGESDIAWLPPVVYAWLAEAVTPIGSIIRKGATRYAAALVVREDSKLRALSDLNEARAGWVDPWSAAGYVVPRLELARAKIDPRKAFSSEKFYGSHREALLALGRDECDVVATYARLSADEKEEILGGWSEIDNLRVHVLATFGAIPPDVIAVRRNLKPRDHERVMKAFRAACSDEKGKALVRALFGGDELHDGPNAGHDELRRAYESAIARGLFDND